MRGKGQGDVTAAAYSLPWLAPQFCGPLSLAMLRDLHLGAYLAHEVTFFFLLCYRPFGIQFHVERLFFRFTSPS